LATVALAQTRANLPLRGFYCNNVNRDDPFQVCRYEGLNETVFLNLKVRKSEICERKNRIFASFFEDTCFSLSSDARASRRQRVLCVSLV
jgi:hypothetical protein